MPLDVLQRQLQHIYDINVTYDIYDFVFSDPDLVKDLDSSANARDTKEKLLVQQEGDDINVSLYLASDVLERLHADQWRFSLNNENIVDFCFAVEGVSHFLYFIWNAEYRRGVTLLELELQAEVDKYIAITDLIRAQKSSRLRNWLFNHVSYDSALGSEELKRYQDANRYAGKYCGQLENRYGRPNRRGELLCELRRFYRKTQGEKLRMIDRHTDPS